MAKWERIIADLRTYQRLRLAELGGVTEMILAKYLSGTCTDEERRAVERARAHSSVVGEVLDTASAVFAELDETPGAEDRPTLWGDLVGCIRAFVDTAGSLITEGFEDRRLPVQQGCVPATMNAPEQVVPSAAWTFPGRQGRASLVVAIAQNPQSDVWRVMLRLHDGLAAGAKGFHLEVKDATGQVLLAGALEELAAEPVELAHGCWTLLVSGPTERWQIPLELGSP